MVLSVRWLQGCDVMSQSHARRIPKPLHLPLRPLFGSFQCIGSPLGPTDLRKNSDFFLDRNGLLLSKTSPDQSVYLRADLRQLLRGHFSLAFGFSNAPVHAFNL